MEYEDFIDFEPRIFNHTGHKELWNYLAENPTEGKEDWPGWKINGGKYSKVDSCPLIWPSGCCTGYYELYKQWAEEGISLEERTSLALKIANLPVMNGVETI